MLVVAIDGHGAAGKSTIARLVAGALGAALVHTDDFFRDPAAAPAGKPARRPAIADYYDWARLRREALKPLLAGQAASFGQYDWDSGRHGGTVTVTPGSLVVVEGVSAAAPALADLVHRSVFVDTPPDERMRRLRCRVKPEDWDDDWLAAEQAYFAVVRPPASFDLIVSGSESLRR